LMSFSSLMLFSSMFRILAVGALAGVSVAQTVAPTVAPADPVLTVHGVCSLAPNALAASAKDCTVVVKRQQFEDLLKIVAPNGKVTETAKRNLAKAYADLLAFQIAAQKSGIDQSSEFQENLEWLRLRTLADLYRRGLEKTSKTVSEEEIDVYYRRNSAEFEEVKLHRMLVPRNGVAVTDPQGFENKALEIATAFRERAAKGEDLDQLQKEAYTAVGVNSPPPATDAGSRRRVGLSSEVRDDVFALRPGEVSKVEKEPYSFVVYKVDAKRTLPKEQVREEISRAIVKEKFDAALESVTGSVRADLNESYFEPAAQR